MDIFDQVVLLLVGAVIGLGATQVADCVRRRSEKKRIASAVYFELVNRVARCLNDYISPWDQARNPSLTDDFAIKRTKVGLYKFAPQTPTVFPALGPAIADLDSNSVGPVLDFYFRLDAWRRDLEAVSNTPLKLDGTKAMQLAFRLGETLESGQTAIQSLRRSVSKNQRIDRDIVSVFPHIQGSLDECLRGQILVEKSWNLDAELKKLEVFRRERTEKVLKGIGRSLA